MKPNYVARKSYWTAFHPALILLSFLIIPIFIIIIRMIIRKFEYYEFYDNKVVYKKGVFSRKETVSTFLGVLSVSVEQPFIARIFNYGDVVVDTVGRWDMDIVGVSKPHKLKRYLETKAASKLTAAFAAGPENFGHFDTSPMI
ncbi:MAG: PH domain-containing protein [Clostridia bacterium]|nr:PH domain-containing protein [Clostridia bacterium]